MNNKPTIKTIAKIAGVSHVTVSKALRDCKDISVETTNKIKKIAKEIGYTPNAYARNLSMKKSDTIGMIVPAMGNDTSYSDIFNIISLQAASKDISILLGSCNRNIELEKTFCKKMCENRVGALIISPISSDISHILDICNNTIPIIFLGGKTGVEQENCITIDYLQSAEIAVEHLYELGHREIALFLYYPINRTINQKIDGYKTAMSKHNLKELIYFNGNSDNTFSAGYDLTIQLINKNELPTAIWCASDIMALGVINALKTNDIQVPEDVSVMGHDDLTFTGLKSMFPTSLGVSKEQMGFTAVEMAINIMENINLSDEQRKQVFSAKLVDKGTTAKVKH